MKKSRCTEEQITTVLNKDDVSMKASGARRLKVLDDDSAFQLARCQFHLRQLGDQTDALKKVVTPQAHSAAWYHTEWFSFFI